MDYDSLPPAIKCLIDRNAYAWLSDAEKASFQQQACDPEPDDPAPQPS